MRLPCSWRGVPQGSQRRRDLKCHLAREVDSRAVVGVGGEMEDVRVAALTLAHARRGWRH